jgi:uncharacterized protein (TIGR03437 family)
MVVSAQPERRVALSGRVRPQARAENDRGAVDSSFALPGVTLLLKRTAAQQSDLAQLVEDQRNPASANFHRWLTPEQYASRFGVDNATLDQITGWLKSQGFTNVTVGRSRTFVTFNGTAGQVATGLNTQLHRYQVNGRMHFANATAPSLPASIAGVTAAILGLDDFRMKPRYKTPSQPEMTASAGVHHIAPADFATIYNLNPLYNAKVDGTGISIAVVGQTQIDMADISAFRTKFNLGAAQVTLKAVPTRPDPGTSSGDLPEADLDIEWAGAVAPNATIVYVYSDDVIQSLIYAIDNKSAPVLTMSYGACEPQDFIDLPSYQSMAQQANAQGMTLLAAAGDSGAGDCEDQGVNIAQNGFAVDIPAAIPEFTGMGGTTLNEAGGSYWNSSNDANGGSALSYIPEVVWNDSSPVHGFASTGGGTSVFFARPSWQVAEGLPSDGARHVPDISLASSANHDGYYFYTSGQGGYVGGTSVAAPTMAGIVALLNHYLVSTNIISKPGLGNINPALYRMAQTAPSVFHDVQGGNNNVPCVPGSPNCTNGSFGVSAGQGYDSVTGLGSIDANQLVHQWSTKPPLNSAVVASIDQSPVFEQPAGSWQFTLTLTEEAGAATTLTGFTIDGVSYTPQIVSLFKSGAIAAGGNISAAMSLSHIAAPKNVIFAFSGVDASGTPWSQEFSVPFQGPQVHITIAGMSNAASGTATFAPGQIVSVYGTAMGNFAQAAGALPLTTYLAGFEAWVNDVPAPLYYVSPNQVNLQIPYETTPGRATLTLGNPFENSKPFSFRVAAAAPGIFTLADGRITPTSSGSVGQAVTLFMTGDGQVSPALKTGNSPSFTTPQPQQAVTITVGGVPVVQQGTDYFIGIPRGLVGVTQVNFKIPDGVAKGLQPVVVSVGGVPSNTAYITVQ